MSFPFMIESMVSVLLLFTILYCVRLNKGITQLRGNEKTLKSTIAELVTATETAERAIAGLKTTVREADQTLGERLRAAEKFTTDIKGQIEAAESVLARVTQIAALRSGAAQAQTPRQNQPDTKAIMAAAQAFADRKRSRAQGLAA
ncbi:MAG TPA: DUF6468 domain-containing protein [Xanthobacteraceae bacterium]|nr:DUF6468 domain-containing protein [Xanthobacteraceae bacterium]